MFPPSYSQKLSKISTVREFCFANSEGTQLMINNLMSTWSIAIVWPVFRRIQWVVRGVVASLSAILIKTNVFCSNCSPNASRFGIEQGRNSFTGIPPHATSVGRFDVVDFGWRNGRYIFIQIWIFCINTKIYVRTNTSRRFARSQVRTTTAWLIENSAQSTWHGTFDDMYAKKNSRCSGAPVQSHRPQKEQIIESIRKNTKLCRTYHWRQHACCSPKQPQICRDASDVELHAGKAPSAGAESTGQLDSSIVTSRCSACIDRHQTIRGSQVGEGLQSGQGKSSCQFLFYRHFLVLLLAHI